MDDRVGVLLVLLAALIACVFLAYFLGIEKGREDERRSPDLLGWWDEIQDWERRDGEA